MPSPRLSHLLICLALLGLTAGPVCAETGRTTPGLVIETGARTAYCDQLLFSPDGTYLLAVGEDKVLRRWGVSAGGFLSAQSFNVRWPILREARGSIFAAAFDRTGERVAFAGFGVKNGLVATARLNGAGRIEAVCDPVPSTETNWSVAFAPDGRHVAYGNDTGEVYLWEPGTKVQPTLFAASKAKTRATNQVRLVAFTGPRKLVTVTADGVVREWDASAPGSAPAQLHDFTGGSVFRAVISLDGGKIAVGMTPTAKTAGTDDGAEAIRRVGLLNLRTKAVSSITLPAADGTRAVRALAFSRDGDRLAVGCNETPKLAKEDFFRLTGGQIFVYAVAKPAAPASKIAHGYNVEALAFHPVRSNVLASAGGDNHEVTLWDAATGEKLSDDAEVRGPANCVWDVTLDKNGRYFAWKDKRTRDPKHPNRLAAGPWRVFDLVGRTGRQILPGIPADFAPVPALDSADGWEVKPTASSAVWRVTGPGGVDVRLDEASGLYNRKFNQEPRCWTFVKSAGKPLRLAVGHQWGVSVYECNGKGLKLVRVMTGHEGQVMCIAPSADGQLLITGSRDQTVCLWSLGQWTAGNEMGAKFEVKGGKLVVADVDAGSPAWEPLNPLDGTDREMNRLAKGDEIEILYIVKEDFVYDPLGQFETERAKGWLMAVTKRTRNATEALNRLKEITPAKEYILAKKRPGQPDLIYKNTTCRQRPLLRFFATRADNPGAGREWVMWRPRDFFYDTSAGGDRYVGWHVNAAQLDQPPAFYPLERYRGSDHVAGEKGEPSGFHRPDKIWPFVMRAFQDPAKVIFTEIEPPRVRLSLTELPKGAKPVGAAKVPAGKDVTIEVSITAVTPGASLQVLKHIDVFLNDHKTQRAKLAPNEGVFKPATIRLPASDLLWGRNVVKVDCLNARGGRGEATVRFDYEPPDRPTANLHALLVGINDYSKAKGNGDGVS
ncbi:MAG: WD40 repeat domain-containing protein, partial [Gemmataceae bacterium]